MRFIEFIAETERRAKKRPSKTLHFQQYDLWVHDITHRYPESEPIEFEDKEVVAVDKNDHNSCYGTWSKTKQSGVTYAKPRPLNISTKFSKR